MRSLPDNYVDLSDLEVVLSVIYVIRESCLRNIYKTEIPAHGPNRLLAKQYQLVCKCKQTVIIAYNSVKGMGYYHLLD